LMPRGTIQTLKSFRINSGEPGVIVSG